MAFLVNEPKPSTVARRMDERSRELSVNPPKVTATGRYEITGKPRASPRVMLGTPLTSLRLASTPVSKGVKISAKSPYTSHSSGIVDWWKEETLGVQRWILGVGAVGLGLLGLSLR